MANGKTKVGVFAKAGYAGAGGSGGYIDYAKIGQQVDAAAAKTAELLKKNPNGVEIRKLTDAASDETAAWLSSKKDEIGRMKELEISGSEEEKKQAVDYLNNIDKGIQQLNSDFENAAAKQAELLSVSNGGNYAKSNTATQSMNFHNMANGHMAAGAAIKEDKNGMPRLMYNNQDASGTITQQAWDTIDVGGNYDNSLYELIEGDEQGKGFAFDILNIAGKTTVQKNPELWNNVHKPKMIKQVKNILKNNPNAAKDLTFQEDDFVPILNNILSENYPNLPTGEDGQLDEESVEYKAAIEELKGDGFKVNNNYFLEQLGIMLDEDFEKAIGGVVKTEEQSIEEEGALN